MLKNLNDQTPEDVTDLGSKLRQRRKDLGLTLEAVAKEAGVTTGFITESQCLGLPVHVA